MEDFIAFVAEVLGVDPAALSGETAYGDVEQWDSLMHMRLVLEVEDRYGVEIPLGDMAGIDTIADLHGYVRGKDS